MNQLQLNREFDIDREDTIWIFRDQKKKIKKSEHGSFYKSKNPSFFSLLQHIILKPYAVKAHLNYQGMKLERNKTVNGTSNVVQKTACHSFSNRITKNAQVAELKNLDLDLN